ncbi:unnamed protein product [Ambrosiozyma monospora]|uniref:Unnamed protein product n=1 Tax=Ambrosiozyma monospora TaxID=43982 RepID=A0ACB5TWK2_AMBMO|nr:unnamed protein product [Ambrosiozyma monospora]
MLLVVSPGIDSETGLRLGSVSDLNSGNYCAGKEIHFVLTAIKLTRITISTMSEQQEQKPVEEKKKTIKTLEEDDEFEDFPEDDWSENQTLGSKQDHLWDESWEDHDDDNDDFTKRLTYVAS